MQDDTTPATHAGNIYHTVTPLWPPVQADAGRTKPLTRNTAVRSPPRHYCSRPAVARRPGDQFSLAQAAVGLGRALSASRRTPVRVDDVMRETTPATCWLGLFLEVLPSTRTSYPYTDRHTRHATAVGTATHGRHARGVFRPLKDECSLCLFAERRAERSFACGRGRAPPARAACGKPASRACVGPNTQKFAGRRLALSEASLYASRRALSSLMM